MRTPPFIALALLAMAPTSCMLGPTDDGVVATMSSPVSFYGFHLQPGRTVQVEALDATRGRWDVVGTATSATSATPTDLSEDLYYWSYSGTLASAYWQRGIEGGRARVRARTPDGRGGFFNLMTVESDWGACYAENDTAAEFSENCASDHSPEAVIQTSDYCTVHPPFGRVDRIVAQCDRVTASFSSTQRYEAASFSPLFPGGPANSFFCMTSSTRGADGRYHGQCTAPYTVLGIDRRAELVAVAAASNLSLSFIGEHPDLCGDHAVLTFPVPASRLETPSTCAGDPGPGPAPDPAHGPDLIIEIGDHDGLVAPFAVCNVGDAAVTTNDFVLRFKGSVQTSWAFYSMVSFLPPTLGAGVCHPLGDAVIGIAGTTILRSSSVEAFIDWENDVAEANELNNRTVKARTIF